MGGIITHGFWFIRCFSFRRSLDRDMGRSSIWSSLNEVTLRETTLYVWLSDCPPPPLFGCVCVGSYFLSLVKLLLDFGSGQQRNGRNWHYWSSPPIPPPPSLKKEKKKEQYDPYKNINISQKQETWLWPFFSCFKLSNVKCNLLLGQDATEIEANFFFSNVILQRVKFPLAANHLMRSKGISNQLESKKDANKTKLYMMAIVRFDGHISRGD